MSIPAYLDSSVYPFNYIELTGLADVETGGVGLISSMRSQLVGGTLNWTEPSTALFKTPVDAAGRFLDVLVTRINSTTIEWRVRNQAATTLCTRRITLGTGACRIYGSTAGVVAEFVQTAENGLMVASAHVLDMAPNLNTDHTLYVIGNGYLNNTSANDNAADAAGEYFAIDNGGAASNNRGWYWQASNGAVPPMISASGKFVFREATIFINFSAIIKMAGRIVHCLAADSNLNGGDERKIYIDTSTVATFKVLGQNPISTTRYMMRKS